MSNTTELVNVYEVRAFDEEADRWAHVGYFYEPPQEPLLGVVDGIDTRQFPYKTWVLSGPTGFAKKVSADYAFDHASDDQDDGFAIVERPPEDAEE